jgi:hypothetical protein
MQEGIEVCAAKQTVQTEKISKEHKGIELFAITNTFLKWVRFDFQYLTSGT